MTQVYPPEHPLGSASAKIDRAKMHVEELVRSISDSTNPDVTVVRKGTLTGDHPVSGSVVDDVTISPRDPTLWSLMIGDAVSNLRASLDHIAWSLAQQQAEITNTPLTASDERGISFPLGDIQGNFGISKCILPAAKPTIEYFQPYNRTQRPELELLAVLDELSRIDKHRLVIAIERLVALRVNATQSKVIRVRLDQPYRQWLLSSAPIEDDFQPEGVFDIVTYPPIRGTRGFSTLELRDIHDLIRDKVLPAFSRFFT